MLGGSIIVLYHLTLGLPRLVYLLGCAFHSLLGVARTRSRSPTMPERKTTPVTRIYNLCGRIHLGPCCINGGPRGERLCMACGEIITEEQRSQINKTWDTVHAMLRPYKASQR